MLAVAASRVIVLGDWRIVVVTPAGRRRYLEILMPYVLRERSWVDAYELWANTSDPSDLDYLETLVARYRGFVRLVPSSHRPAASATVGLFYVRCVDPGSVYVKIDDDICFFAEGALEALVRFRLARRDHFLVLANVVNTALCSAIHQSVGAVDTRSGVARFDALCSTGWKSGPFAADAHRRLLASIEEGNLEHYCFEPRVLPAGQRASINCCSWFGADFAEFGGILPPGAHDEDWLCTLKPVELGRSNCLHGGPVLAHFAYYPQRRFLEGWTNLLDQYRRLSQLVLRNGPT